MILAVSHAVIASDDVPRITRFLKDAFLLQPHFENEMFVEFVLPSKFRLAFFKPVGLSAKTFTASAERGTVGLGLTVNDVDAFYASLTPHLATYGASTFGPPKTHPWGEKSFLLKDPDGNRWEITQSPTAEGYLSNRESQ